MEVKQALGLNIRRLREAMGISQEELGYRAGLHRTYIGSIERGERNVALLNLCQIARALQCEPADLLKDIRLPKYWKPKSCR